MLAEPFLHRTRKLPCIFATLFVCYSSRSRSRDSLLRPCYDFLLFFTTQTRPVHRETDNGDEKFITPINKIHNPILGYGYDFKSLSYSKWAKSNHKTSFKLSFKIFLHLTHDLRLPPLSCMYLINSFQLGIILFNFLIYILSHF